MKIAYVTTYDATDPNAWSGSGHYMYHALIQAGFEVEVIGGLKNKFNLLFSAKKLVLKFIFGKNYLKDREPVIVKNYARQLENRLGSTEYDLVFSPSSIPLAYLSVDKPMVFWTDATFAGMIDFYPDFSNFSKQTLRMGNQMEQLALDKCKYVVYSSEWAAKTATDHYEVTPAKIKVVPFGANIPSAGYPTPAEKVLEAKEAGKIKLLFIAVDWYRKGGDKALEIAEYINEKGHACELHIVGCQPPQKTVPMVFSHGFLNKSNPGDLAKLKSLFESSHFFLLPTRADCVPVVLAESCAYGLPCITTNVGGITSAIQEGLNGFTFDVNVDVSLYANKIIEVYNDPGQYKTLVENTLKQYEERLNWHSAGQTLKEILTSKV